MLREILQLSTALVSVPSKALYVEGEVILGKNIYGFEGSSKWLRSLNRRLEKQTKKGIFKIRKSSMGLDLCAWVQNVAIFALHVNCCQRPPYVEVTK